MSSLSIVKRSISKRCAFACVLAATACAGTPPSEGAHEARPSATATADASTAADAPLPDSVPDLIRLVPKDATAVLGLPNLETIRKGTDPTLVKLFEDAASQELGPRIGVSAELVAKVMTAFDGGVVYLDRSPIPNPKGAAIVRLRDTSVIAPLVEAAKLKSTGPDRWSNDTIFVALLANAKVAVIANHAEALERSLALATGKGESFADAPLFRPRKANALWAAADLGAIGEKLGSERMRAGSRLVFGLDFDGELELELAQIGDNVPRLGLLLSPSALSSVEKLPAGPVVAGGFSLKRAPKRTLTDVVTEVGRAQGIDLVPDVEQGLKQQASLTLADLERGLGDEAAFAVYYDGPQLTDPNEMFKTGAALLTVAVRDDKLARTLVDLAAKELGVKATNGKLRRDKRGMTLDIASSPGLLTVGFGGKPMLDKLARTSSKADDRLSGSSAFSAARRTGKGSLNGLVFADFQKIGALLPADAGIDRAAFKGGALLTLELKPNEQGSEYALRATGGASVVAGVGALSAVAIYGVRRYLISSKTAEAKNTIGAIARGAMGAFEREQAGGPNSHALCKSAVAVPAKVPAGKKYQPDETGGRDYATGNNEVGWKCLKFTITNPHYYQYEYRVGGNYKGPKRGGPDPGKDGFEASAEGDLDGDGKTSLFTLTGTVDRATQRLKLATQIFIADELE